MPRTKRQFNLQTFEIERKGQGGRIDLSNVECKRCKEKRLLVTTNLDVYQRIVLCTNCQWWTWLKNFNVKGRNLQYENLQTTS